MASQQKFTVDIDRAYSDLERRTIANEIIDFIINRTRNDNLDKNNRAFPGYSSSYADSLAFKLGGKSRSDIDLTLSGDMLDSIKVLSTRAGQITIGFDAGTNENAKAEGNIIGSYGQPSGNPTKSRDFLGIHPEDLSAILERNRPSATQLQVEQDTLSSVLERLNIAQAFGSSEDN